MMALQLDVSLTSAAFRRRVLPWWSVYRSVDGRMPDLILDYTNDAYGLGGQKIAQPIAQARLGPSVVDGRAAGLLVEPQRSNLVARSVARPTWGPVGPVTLTALDEARAGVFPGLLITSGGASWHRAAPGNMTFEAGQSYAMTLWYGQPSAAMMKATLYSTATTPPSNLELQGAAGQLAAVVQNGGQITDIRNDQITDGLYRMRCRFSLSQTVTTTWGFGSGTATAGESVTIYGLQIEEGADATGYIRSDGVAVSRGADRYTLAATGWGGLEGGTLALRATPMGAGAAVFASVTDLSGEKITALCRADGEIVLRYGALGSVEEMPTGMNALRDQAVAIALSWSGTALRLTLGGSPVQTAAPIAFGALSELRLYDDDIIAAPAPVQIGRLLHYPMPVSDAALQALSS